MRSPEHDRQLTLLDATCIMLGIVIGSGVFTTPAEVAKHSPNAAVLLSIWLAGGVASLLGALCFAELSTRYPEHGGTFAFLNRAYGPWAGLLFAWTDFWIVRPANAGAVALVLGNYANAAWPLPVVGSWGYSVAAVLLATAMHLGGVSVGRWSQNVMSLAKVLGLLLIVAAALAMPRSTAPESVGPTSPASWGHAFVLVMFCYGGWSDLSNVAAEVRDPSRNLLRSLVLGISAITLTYLAINGAAVAALGVERLGQSPAFAAEITASFGSFGERFVTLLVILCCFGSLSGVVFTGSRVYYALGQSHRLFSWLGGWDDRRGTPPQSLLAQAGISCLLLLFAGQEKDGFERLVIFAGPCYWGFMLLASLAVIVLRQRDQKTPLAFRVPLYPLLPLLFALVCGWLVVSAGMYMFLNLSVEGLYTAVVLLGGFAILLRLDPHSRSSS